MLFLSLLLDADRNSFSYAGGGDGGGGIGGGVGVPTPRWQNQRTSHPGRAAVPPQEVSTLPGPVQSVTLSSNGALFRNDALPHCLLMTWPGLHSPLQPCDTACTR